MSRLVGLTTYRLWPSKILLVTGALPLAGGISAKSTNWSDKIVSTNNLSSDGSPGATTTILRMARGGRRAYSNGGQGGGWWDLTKGCARVTWGRLEVARLYVVVLMYFVFWYSVCTPDRPVCCCPLDSPVCILYFRAMPYSVSVPQTVWSVRGQCAGSLVCIRVDAVFCVLRSITSMPYSVFTVNDPDSPVCSVFTVNALLSQCRIAS